MKMIPSALYNQIVKLMPIASVEAIIIKDNSMLFLKRNNYPVKDEWWFPGGRIRKGETMQQALYREIKEETGLTIEIIKFVGVYTRIFTQRHDVTIVFLCKCSSSKVALNEEHAKYKFFKKIPKNTHQYLLQVIEDSKLEMPLSLME
jgi:ADP-ribose pyrophosphatase YjhB (NUDIX family)